MRTSLLVRHRGGALVRMWPRVSTTVLSPEFRSVTARARWSGWQALLSLFFTWLALEDQVRKSFDNPIGIYFVKDLIALALIAPCVRPRLWRREARLVPRSLAAILAWGFLLHLLGSLNPGLTNPLVPLVGLKLTFSYVPLVLVGARFVRDGGDARTLCRTMLFIGVLVSAAGIYQATVDPTFLNPEPAGGLEGAQLRMTRGGVQYVTSTFLSPARYVMFLLFVVGAGALLYLTEETPARRVLAITGLGIVALALVTSGARLGAVGLGGVLLLIYGLLWLRDRRVRLGTSRSPRRRVSIQRGIAIALLIGATVAVAAHQLPPVADALLFYWESLFADRAEGAFSRLRSHLELANPDLRTWVFGHGTGTASFGIGYVGEEVNIMAEGGYGMIIWELGGLGLAFYLLLATSLTAILLRALSDSRQRPVWAVAPCLGAVIVFSVWYANILAPVLQQYVVSVFLWLFTGVILGSRNSGGTSR